MVNSHIMWIFTLGLCLFYIRPCLYFWSSPLSGIVRDKKINLKLKKTAKPTKSNETSSVGLDLVPFQYQKKDLNGFSYIFFIWINKYLSCDNKTMTQRTTINKFTCNYIFIRRSVHLHRAIVHNIFHLKCVATVGSFVCNHIPIVYYVQQTNTIQTDRDFKILIRDFRMMNEAFLLVIYFLSKNSFHSPSFHRFFSLHFVHLKC